MFEQLIAVARNTFFESIRQPIMLVVLVIATLALILANPLSAFTMEDDQRMLIDMGMSTIFLCGALLAAFVATNVLGREIENKTALTVVSKPVGRPIFVIGKYLGVATALLVAALYMCVVFALVERHTVLQTVREAAHIPSWVFGIAALLVGIGVGVWCNYFYNWVFTSTVIVVTTPLVGLAYILSMRFDENFGLQPFSEAFKPEVWLAMSLLLVAILVMTAIALAASTRLKQVMTLVVTLGVFLLGMMSDWLFGRPIGALRESWLQTAAAQGKTELVEKVTTTVFTAGDTEVRSEMVRGRHRPVGNLRVRWRWAGDGCLPDRPFDRAELPGALADRCPHPGAMRSPSTTWCGQRSTGGSISWRRWASR